MPPLPPPLAVRDQLYRHSHPYLLSCRLPHQPPSLPSLASCTAAAASSWGTAGRVECGWVLGMYEGRGGRQAQSRTNLTLPGALLAGWRACAQTDPTHPPTTWSHLGHSGQGGQHARKKRHKERPHVGGGEGRNLHEGRRGIRWGKPTRTSYIVHQKRETLVGTPVILLPPSHGIETPMPEPTPTPPGSFPPITSW